MSSKKTQKINNLSKPNGSQTPTPANGGNPDDNDHMKAASQQHNPQQLNPQMANGMPPNNMGMMGNNSMPMNTGMNFGMNNPNFRGIPNANLHPQQLAALQAQAHFANMQQNNPNAANNPQYQQYLQQLQQNQMFMQMQNQQQNPQNPQNPQQAQTTATQQFQGQVPQQQIPPHFAGQQQQQQQQVHPFQQSQQHQQHPQQARQPQQPTPQQTHPTQQQPTPQQAPQQAPTPQQGPQQLQPQQQGPKPDPKSRVGSIVAGQVPQQQQQQRPLTAGNAMMNRGPQSSHGGQPPQLPQGGAQGAAGQQQQPQGVGGRNGGSNAATLNVMNFRKQMSNLATLKFLDFCELIGVRSDSTKNILYWRKIITDYFSEVGVLRYSVKSGVDSRQFEFSVPIIPRFFFSIIQSGVTRMEIQPGLLRTQVLANGTTYLESSRCCFTHYYSDGSYVNIHGNIRGILNQNLKLDWLDFQTHVFIPGVEWPSLEKLLSDEAKVKELFYSQENSSEKASDIKRLQLLTKLRSNYKVFHSMSNFGLQESVMRVMQVSDVMAHLKSLMLFSISSDTTGPLNALDSFVSQSILANKNKNEGEKVPTPRPGVKDEKASPLDNISSNSPMSRGKVPPLDMSQSTLTKRRRKSNLDNGLSPKSTADSPKQVTKSNKKTKR